jgi:alpha-D-ribose 1-methylphosphonate 5-triphosphate diphosphatase
MIFTNARIVTPVELVPGSLAVGEGRLGGVDSGITSLPAAVDCEGDYLLPGLVELHTDALDRHLIPRPGVRWNAAAALAAHDAQMAALGITTVLDSISLGIYDQGHEREHDLQLQAIAAVEAAGEPQSLRAEHFLHLRLEITHAEIVDTFAPFAASPRLRLASLMDHTPGQRQWRDLERWRLFNSRRLKLTDAEMMEIIARRRENQSQHSERNRPRLAELARAHGIPLATHDDTTPSHVDEAVANGATISEFPTTLEAAAYARQQGLTVVMGAPNLMIGGSHSGNVATAEVAGAGLLNALASDYVPNSLIEGVFRLAAESGFALPQAVATATSEPARMAGLADRGRIEPGLRADLVRVRLLNGVPLVRGVWREGVRVA